MPNADTSNVMLIEVKSGHYAITRTWVLGRLMRDLSDKLDTTRLGGKEIPGRIRATGKQKVSPTDPSPELQPLESLRIKVYKTQVEPSHDHAVPVVDWIWFSGFAIILVQLIISIIPWILDGNWAIFMVTISGVVLALIGGSLPQWRKEKWATKKGGGPTVALTTGVGSRQVIVILGREKVGLDLSILANQTALPQVSSLTRLATGTLALLWIFYIVTVAGLEQGSGTWCTSRFRISVTYCSLEGLDLLGIGLLGSIQNMFAAGAARSPSAHGIHIEYCETIQEVGVLNVLKKAEECYPDVGVGLLDVFFPGGLRAKDRDLEFWQRVLRKRAEPNEHGTIIGTKVAYAQSLTVSRRWSW